VTGGARGIGRGIAEELVKRGARVAALDLKPMDDAASEILREFTCNVGEEESVRTALDRAIKWLGGLDGLVNNAGIMVEKPIEETSLADYDRLMAVNLRGVFLVTKHAIAALRAAAGDGHTPKIVNIASELAHLGRPEYIAYCASKGGVISMTRAMAREFAPAVAVNALAPGPTNTDMLKAEKNYEAWSGTGEGIPLGRVGTVQDIANAVAFLIGEDSGFMTGSVVDVNGGAAMY